MMEILAACISLYIHQEQQYKKRGVVLNATRGSSGKIDASSAPYMISVSQLFGLVKEAYPKMSWSTLRFPEKNLVLGIFFSKQIREAQDEIDDTKEKTGDGKRD